MSERRCNSADAARMSQNLPDYLAEVHDSVFDRVFSRTMHKNRVRLMHEDKQQRMEGAVR